MDTRCNQQTFEFQSLGRRDIVTRFDGGRITSDGGILLRQIEEYFGFVERFAAMLYEQEYCGRGDRENRIKEQQLFLAASRPCATARHVCEKIRQRARTAPATCFSPPILRVADRIRDQQAIQLCSWLAGARPDRPATSSGPSRNQIDHAVRNAG